MRRNRRAGRRQRFCKDEESKAKALQTAWRFATDRTETLPLSEARKVVADPPICPYCRIKIPYRDISIDHMLPRSRGGTSQAENLVYCDRICNQAKGNLTAEEFRALVDFLSGYLMMKESVLRRLVAAGRIYNRYKRR